MKWPHLLLIPILISVVFEQSRANPEQATPHQSNRDYTHLGIQIYSGYGGESFSVDNLTYNYLDESGNWGSFLFGFNVGFHRNISLIWETTTSVYSVEGKLFTSGVGGVGLKLTPFVGPTHHTQPFAQFSVGAAWISSYHDLFMGAPKLSLGVSHFVGRRASLFGVGSLTISHMDHRGEDQSLEDEFNVTFAGMHVGLQFRLY